MPIKLKCPTPGCGRQLTVRDDLAGKVARCPACCQPMKIPVPRTAPAPQAPPRRPAAEDGPERDPTEDLPLPPSRRPPTVVTYQATPPDPGYEEVGYEVVEGGPRLEANPAQGAGSTDYDVIDEGDEEYRSVRPSSEPRYGRAGTGEAEDDGSRGPRGRHHRTRGSRRKSSSTQQALTMAVGTGLLALLGLTTLLPWFSWSASFGDRSFTQNSLVSMRAWEKQVVLGVSLGAALLAGMGLSLSAASPGSASDALRGAGASLGGGWGALVVVWATGWIWKTLKTDAEMKARLQTIKAGMRLDPALVQSLDMGLHPGIGMWFCVLLAAAAVGVFAYVLIARRQAVWLCVCYPVGFLIGVLLLVLNVKPWESFFETASNAIRGIGG